MRSQQRKDLKETKHQSFFLKSVYSAKRLNKIRTKLIILPKECLFCKKIKRNKDKTKESLSLCIDKRTEESIKSAATNMGDFALLGILDMIAAEARYHRTCYRQYLTVNYKKQRLSSSYSDAENEAYKKVISFCVELPFYPKIIPFTSLLEIMKTTLAEKNEVISDASNKYLRRKIESDFKTVKFINVDGLLYVYP